MKLTNENSSNTTKIVLALAVLVLVVYGFYGLVYEPQSQKISELGQQGKVLEAENQEIKRYKEEHPEPDKHIEELDSRKEEINKALLNELEFSGYVKQRDRAALETGVQILSMNLRAAVNKAEYREIPVEIETKGSYIEYLKKLEKTERLNTISEIGLSAKNNLVTCKIIMRIYSYGIDAAASKPGAKT